MAGSKHLGLWLELTYPRSGLGLGLDNFAYLDQAIQTWKSFRSC